MPVPATQRTVLLIGRSQLVLDEAVAGLHALGYRALATNEFFSDITARFPPAELDLVVFGGAVSAERKAALTEKISARNPKVIFVNGLAGIPGLIVHQVHGAFTAGRHGAGPAPTYQHGPRSVGLRLAEPARVKMTVWWMTSTASPDPASDSLIVLDDHLAIGDHTISIPDQIPPEHAFVTVQRGAAIYSFSVGAI